MTRIYLLLIIPLLYCCNNANSPSNQNQQEYSSTNSVNAVNVDNESECINYLSGKTFSGGSAKIEFMENGNVSIYNANTNELAFACNFRLCERYGNASRHILISSIDGNGTLKMLLSADGKLMDETNFIIYKP